ncbi:DUF559 domain-containing protein [Parabacteroides sp. PF5-9]|uniref:endonuclease domain-containing protein n=1 Tax=Parabacteroides sp. PF5-9 TaxID=1742404 RepID=UPI0024751940|nr:DUF559 domain-containing protein [Parabacteroides sp. PF5-9]MDH6357858.1 very-short-patch-repair endonuclease [Parabacteroides sp. PF5-9]
MNTEKWVNKRIYKDYRHYLRQHATPAEKGLWKLLKNHQFEGLKFRRQQSIGKYIIDFYCPEIRLAIELDGQVHVGNEEYDEQRAIFIKEKMNIYILRYENKIVFEHPKWILDDISEYRKRWMREKEE